MEQTEKDFKYKMQHAGDILVDTVETVLKHYFRPDREHFRNALALAMPEVLTGIRAARLPPAEELAMLAGKLADGTASEDDKKRFRKLAAKV